MKMQIAKMLQLVLLMWIMMVTWTCMCAVADMTVFCQTDPGLQDRIYLNNGKGEFTKSKDALPMMLVSKGCVVAADINGDGFIDFL